MPVTFKDDVGGGAESQLTGNIAEEEEAPLKEIGFFGSMSLGTSVGGSIVVVFYYYWCTRYEAPDFFHHAL